MCRPNTHTHTHRTIHPFLPWSKELDKDGLSGRQLVKVLISKLDRGGSRRVDTEQCQLKQHKKQRYKRLGGRHCCQSEKRRTILNQHVGSHGSNKTETRAFGKWVFFFSYYYSIQGWSLRPGRQRRRRFPS